MSVAFQIDIRDKRYAPKLSKIAGQAKRAYHRWLRHRPILEDEVGGHLPNKYPGGWMY